MRKLVPYMLWLFCWLVVGIFAHDYVARSLNVENQDRFKQIQQNQLNYNWQFNSFDDVIDSFRSGWLLDEDGITSASDQVEISLELNGEWIYPNFQQRMKWGVSVDPSVIEGAHVLLEMSDQQQGVFYYSPELRLADYLIQVDLNSFGWRKKTTLNHEISEAEFSWHQLPAMSALVIRFYFPHKTKLMLHNVKILQTKKPENETLKFDQCQQALTGCFFTNQQKSVNQTKNIKKEIPTVEFPVLTDSSPFLWLLLAACLLLVGIYLFVGQLFHGVVFLVFVVFGFIIIMSQPLMLKTGQFVKWPLLIFVAVLFWYCRDWFKRPNQTAASLWLGSTIIASLMLLLSGWQTDYIWQLPGYFIWALFQQLLLGPLVTDYLHDRLKDKGVTTAMLVGVLFSIVHAPNHSLMLATLFGGFVWSYSWIKYKNIYANAFSHAVLALTFYQVMPIEWLGSARIGVFF